MQDPVARFLKGIVEWLRCWLEKVLGSEQAYLDSVCYPVSRFIAANPRPACKLFSIWVSVKPGT